MRRGILAQAAFLALAFIAVRAGAQPFSVAEEARAPRPKPDCLDGSKYDDAKFEQGLRPTLFDDNFVQLIEAKSYPAKLQKVCIAWRRTSFWNGIVFDLRIWTTDGPNGGPGTRIDTIRSLTASRIPTRAVFYTYDLSGYNIIIDGPVYIGPFWDPLSYFLVYLATDTSPKTPYRRSFYGVGILDDQPPRFELGPGSAIPNFRAFGIRATFTTP